MEMDESFESLENRINELKSEKIKIETAIIQEDKDMVKKFKKQNDTLDKIEKNFQKYKLIVNEKSTIEENLNDYLKIKNKIKTTYFCFMDFVDLFEKKKNISKIVFNPYEVCKDLLEKELYQTVDIFENDVDDLLNFFRNL